MNKNYKAFTLIELLIVISIIAILAALAMFGLGGVFAKGRNTERRSDIKQYQEALEIWANSHNGLYPVNAGGVNTSSLCTYLGLSNCPNDPDATWNYTYISSAGTPNGSGGACTTCASEYVLYARLEESTTTYYVVCHNGRVGLTTSVPTVATCASL